MTKLLIFDTMILIDAAALIFSIVLVFPNVLQISTCSSYENTAMSPLLRISHSASLLLWKMYLLHKYLFSLAERIIFQDFHFYFLQKKAESENNIQPLFCCKPL